MSFLSEARWLSCVAATLALVHPCAQAGGVRCDALGGAFVALAEDTTAWSANPAGPIGNRDREGNSVLGVTAEFSSISSQQEDGNWHDPDTEFTAFAAQVGSFGLFYERDAFTPIYDTGRELAGFEQSTLGLALGTRLGERVTVGATLDMMSLDSPDGSMASEGTGFSLGMLWQAVDWQKAVGSTRSYFGLRLGGAYRSEVIGDEAIGEDDPMLRGSQYSLGTAANVAFLSDYISWDLNLALQYDQFDSLPNLVAMEESLSRLAVGVEWNWLLTTNTTLSLRAGQQQYETEQGLRSDGASSFGIGLGYKNFAIDFASSEQVLPKQYSGTWHHGVAISAQF
ncbi:hypothetical protein [Ferrimonas pelagia]|uniref:Uncharacterized protein n=1 Tax=Ferrimonas pelagia TaxID=1177826 RepID=A0ABP9EA43_9GAMM